MPPLQHRRAACLGRATASARGHRRERKGNSEAGGRTEAGIPGTGWQGERRGPGGACAPLRGLWGEAGYVLANEKAPASQATPPGEPTGAVKALGAGPLGPPHPPGPVPYNCPSARAS